MCFFCLCVLCVCVCVCVYAELMTHNKGAVYKTMFYCGLSSFLRGASVLFLKVCLHGTAVLKGVQIFLKCLRVLRSGVNKSQQQQTAVLKGVEENIVYPCSTRDVLEEPMMFLKTTSSTVPIHSCTHTLTLTYTYTLTHTDRHAGIPPYTHKHKC